MTDYLKTEALKDIADAFEATTRVLANHSNRIDVLEKDVAYAVQLAARGAKVASKSNKKLLIVGVGVGIYIGYKVANKEFEDRKRTWREAVKDKQPANAQPKSTQNGENGTDAPQS